MYGDGTLGQKLIVLTPMSSSCHLVGIPPTWYYTSCEHLIPLRHCCVTDSRPKVHLVDRTNRHNSSFHCDASSE